MSPSLWGRGDNTQKTVNNAQFTHTRERWDVGRQLWRYLEAGSEGSYNCAAVGPRSTPLLLSDRNRIQKNRKCVRKLPASLSLTLLTAVIPFQGWVDFPTQTAALTHFHCHAGNRPWRRSWLLTVNKPVQIALFCLPLNIRNAGDDSYLIFISCIYFQW